MRIINNIVAKIDAIYEFDEYVSLNPKIGYFGNPKDINSFEKVASGAVEIQAKKKGKIKESIIYHVRFNVESVHIEEKIDSINTGEKFHFTAYVLPENATNKAIKWNSLTPSIGIIDEETGVFTPLRPGMATIEVEAEDRENGRKTDKCKIEVIQIIPVESVKTTHEIEMCVDESTTVKAKVLPSNATNQTVKWECVEGSACVELNQLTGELVAIKAGMAFIKVTTLDGNKTDICEVIIKSRRVAENIQILRIGERVHFDEL